MSAHFSKGNVPFSWEKKPGVSKETTQLSFLGMEVIDEEMVVIKLLPLPPCPPMRRSSSMRGLRRQGDRDDPFLAAYNLCTKTSTNDVKRGNYKSTHGNNNKSTRGNKNRSDFISGIRSFLVGAPCKRSRSSAVREGNLVRVSRQLH